MNQIVKLDKGNELTVPITSLSHDGRGIALINQKKAFINGALAGEIVTCKITHKHRRYYEAEITQILKPAAQRVAAPCQHHNICGGCSLQHMDMSAQLIHKQNTLLEQLKHFGQVEPQTILPPLNLNSLGYRRKARLGVKFVLKKNKLLIGFREKASRYLADLSECLVLHPKIGQRLTELSELIQSLAQFHHIPQVEFAMGDQEAALIFRHLAPLPIEDLAKLINFGKKNDFHIYVQPNTPLPIQKLWPEHTPEHLSYRFKQINFLFHPLDFTQINLELNALMIEQVLLHLEPQKNDRVLDLFCGIGNFSLPMALEAEFVTGVEGSEEMAQKAQQNALQNNLKNTAFYAANLMEPQADWAWIKQNYNKILLDPPRLGAKEILPYLKPMNAEKIVYVSCNPATLARDTAELVHKQGYNLKKIGIMNMFPHTTHIEAIAVFEKT